MDAVDAEEGVSRAPSENTCFGVQFTGVRYTLPDTGVHLEVDEKSSPPSTMVPAAAAWIANGLPEAPAAGTVTSSRYVAGSTTMVLPAPARALTAAEMVLQGSDAVARL